MRIPVKQRKLQSPRNVHRINILFTAFHRARVSVYPKLFAREKEIIRRRLKNLLPLIYL